MDKLDFLMALEEALSQLPEDDRRSSVEYYAELIDDRMEDGVPENEAVESLGSVEKIAEQILMDMPLGKLVKSKVKNRRKMRGWEITLLILGFPLWFPLLVAVLAVIFSIYVSLWSVVISLYAVFAALAGSAVGIVLGSIVLCIFSGIPQGLFLLGAGLICAGLALFFLPVCNLAAKGSIWIGKKLLQGIKSCFIRKGDAK